MSGKETVRYSKEDLVEFEELIQKKLEVAQKELAILVNSISRNNDSSTGQPLRSLEDGAGTAQKEQLNQLAARQQKFIKNLENALVRIKNGTYGICKDTGNLISKERLRAVPHTQQSIAAKKNEIK